jgi:hypothetical protein
VVCDCAKNTIFRPFLRNNLRSVFHILPKVSPSSKEALRIASKSIRFLDPRDCAKIACISGSHVTGCELKHHEGEEDHEATDTPPAAKERL